VNYICHVQQNKLSLESFNYLLPPERIAQFPLQERDLSKLLIYKDGHISEKRFELLPEELPENSLLIFNDTRVIQARLLFVTSTKAHIEIFLLEPVEPSKDMRQVIHEHKPCLWKCLVGNVKRWRDGILILKGRKDENEFLLRASLEKNEGETYLVRFDWDKKEFSFAEVLSAAGHVPLPPYIKRNDKTEDKVSYQTIFSHEEGSVAAPTAGLHFTEKVFNQLEKKNISKEFLTLHVGAGTFLPVKTEEVEKHTMHSERVYVKKSTIENLLQQTGKGKIIPVGTTSLRTLESLYWFGVQLSLNDEADEMNISQWEYRKQENAEKRISAEESLSTILRWLGKKDKTEFTGYTQIMIVPGYEFKIADALITNFHLPKSTLLLLIAAFIGDDWKKIYDYALQNNFRFLSYGDSSLLFKK